MNVCGVDEAGRGPALGSLFIAGVIIDEEKISILKELGVNDSKVLTAKKREELFDRIIETVDDYVIIELSPAKIDEALRSQVSNLNHLELVHMAKILKKLKADKSIVDCCDPNTERFAKLLRDRTKLKGIVAEHKAEKYEVVAAASILAKVSRDRSMVKASKKLKIDLGSGYGSDPKTQNFLKENWKDEKYSKIIRKEWGSYKRIKEESSQMTLDF